LDQVARGDRGPWGGEGSGSLTPMKGPKGDFEVLDPGDRKFLERAVLLGRRGWGRVHPNPMVGCVLVKDGVAVGEGWHEEFGGPHAETNALARAGEGARGATAYVSLEPCNHHGRTPPCSLALREAGIARVVYGGRDPGSESGGGAERLREAGVEVLGPVLSQEDAARENPAFFHNVLHESTFVAVKLAHTLDGRVARVRGERTTITGPEAQEETHRLRAGFDGIMVGSETALVDDPLLTVRMEAPLRKQPVRLILDSRARLSPEAAVFREVGHVPVVIFTALDASEAAVRDLEGAGAEVHRVPREGPGGLSLEAVLTTCWGAGVRSIFCEGGPRLAFSLLEARRAGRLYLFVAPFVLGETGVPAFPGGPLSEGWATWDHVVPPTLFGRDVLFTLQRKS
jgi:diaminohydroxyphosphoribosylaminopyrimidine deaminase / 5-amino-6-(5-phosphoribosylamino)uracil reductase